MTLTKSNKRKIINDPIYGLMTLQSNLVFDLIEHPLFQRLRRIKQLGVSYLTFPGANHTRFEHSIGATHLTREAIKVLRLKNYTITDEEAEATCIAMLLHDVGHMPFSHLSEFFFADVSHEAISLSIMHQLNKEFSGRLSLAIEIFNNRYEKKFLHQLISGQLDADRLDYLMRDSFYTGVVEGTIGFDRIIKMLNVSNGQLVVDAKGIYSIEKFLIARRLMYWQVYLHKTVVAAEYLIINLIKRCQVLVQKKADVFLTPALSIFLKNKITAQDFKQNAIINEKSILDWFLLLDDIDLMAAFKAWANSNDFVLKTLSSQILHRKLLKTEIREQPLNKSEKKVLLNKISQHYKIDLNEAEYFLMSEKLSHKAYDINTENIYLLDKNGEIRDVKDASDINFTAMGKTVSKYFVCYPKGLIVT